MTPSDVQSNIPHAFSSGLDFADLLYPSPGPAVVPSVNRLLSMRWFGSHWGARDGAASPTRALVLRFRIDSVADEVATSTPRKPLLGLGNPTASAVVYREGR